MAASSRVRASTALIAASRRVPSIAGPFRLAAFEVSIDLELTELRGHSSPLTTQYA